MKGKRDAAIEGTPYSYEQPQKSYQVYTHQQQQKSAMVEYHQAPQKSVQVEYHQQPQKSVQEYQQPQQKVAPLNHYEKLQAASLQSAAPTHAAPLHVQPQEQHYEQAQQYQFPAGYGHSGGESLFANSPYKFEYNYVPSYEIEKMPAVHYSQDINNPFLGFSDYKNVQYASYKPSSPYHQEYSFESPAPAHNFQSHAYLIPQQNEHLHQAYLADYAAAHGGAGQSGHYYGGFSQQPSALFVPQAISVSGKPAKVPDYASGLKGLGHYSTVSSLAAPAPTKSVHKQTYEAPSYVQYSHSQTERPFKASAYLGSTPVGHDSYSEQSINAKPSAQYLPPSKTYLPAKEQQQYVAPSKTYLPAKEQQIYVPAKEEQQYVSIKPQHHYVPSQEHYAPSQEYHYVPEQSPVQYQIEYIQAPAKNYLPAAPASNYLPAKAEQPKASYLPPKKTYLPASQPTSSYLPPSNPYQASYHSSSAQQQAPAQHYQYQQQDAYESAEYQSVTPSGHK